MKFKSVVALAALTVTFVAPLAAQTIDIRDAGVRTSAPGQKATSAFMKMRVVAGGLDLPIGKTVVLKLAAGTAAPAQ